MSLYIRQLQAYEKAERERLTGEANAAKVVKAEAARERLASLDDRVERLLTSIPTSVQREGLSLPTLRALLRGRQGGACHSGELGRALRRLGWTRKRCWRGDNDGGFSARWYPPTTN